MHAYIRGRDAPDSVWGIILRHLQVKRHAQLH